MKARIFKPTRTAMQSGVANTQEWRLEFIPEKQVFIDPLMGWPGMTETTREIMLTFATEAEALAYVKRNNIDFELVEPKIRIVKPKSYAANFAFKQVV